MYLRTSDGLLVFLITLYVKSEKVPSRASKCAQVAL